MSTPTSPVLLTGATGSLGRATAWAFARRGVPLILLGRSRDALGALAQELKSSTGVEASVVVGDLGELASVRAAAEAVGRLTPALSALVHTAAVFRRARVDRDGLEDMFATNHLGAFLLTTALEPQLRAGRARVVTVTAPSTSTLDFGDLQATKRFSAFSAFGASKACNLLFTFEAARRLRGSGVTFDAFHPGLVKSTLLQEAPWLVRTLANLVSKGPGAAAEALVGAALAPGVDGEGRLLTLGGPMKAPASSLDVDAQARLWVESERLVGATASRMARPAAVTPA